MKLPALVTLLGARTAIAMKGAATRQRNKEAKAKGEPQVHGKVAKTRKRAQEKAALATLQQQQAPTQPLLVSASGKRLKRVKRDRRACRPRRWQ